MSLERRSGNLEKQAVTIAADGCTCDRPAVTVTWNDEAPPGPPIIDGRC
jgi:hypothetical protein